MEGQSPRIHLRPQQDLLHLVQVYLDFGASMVVLSDFLRNLIHHQLLRHSDHQKRQSRNLNSEQIVKMLEK